MAWAWTSGFKGTTISSNLGTKILTLNIKKASKHLTKVRQHLKNQSLLMFALLISSSLPKSANLNFAALATPKSPSRSAPKAKHYYSSIDPVFHVPYLFCIRVVRHRRSKKLWRSCLIPWQIREQDKDQRNFVWFLIKNLLLSFRWESIEIILISNSWRWELRIRSIRPES